MKKPKPAVLPEVPAERTVTLNVEERQALVALIDIVCDWPHVPLERKRWFAKLSDKIVPEEEAARMLQDMGYTIVEKEKPHGH